MARRPVPERFGYDDEFVTLKKGWPAVAVEWIPGEDDDDPDFDPYLPPAVEE